MPKRVLIGVVTRDKADQTRRVEVPRLVRHPMYGKTLRRRTVCYAHDGVVYCHGQSEPTLEWSPWESLGGPGGGVEDLAIR